MEGLIKGLVDVALGHDGRNDDVEQESRSRSTWSEVVSGDQDDKSRRHDNNQWITEENDQSDGWNPEIPPRSRPQKAHDEQFESNEGNQRHGYAGNQWGRKEEQADSSASDDWETVGKKHPKKPHKIPKQHWEGYKRPPSEQDYSDEVETGSSFEPTREELDDLSQACNKLWELDLNRLVAQKDYEIDCGEGKKVYNPEDMAQGSLFKWVNEDVFCKPTFSRFCSLLDNYNPKEGCKEVVTSEERQEQVAFIEEISRTAPIKYLHKYLSSKRIVSENFQDFKRILTSLWFDLYGRGGTAYSSSAFEHVFVGEIKTREEQEVSGFHNWLQFYLEEAKGKVDYQGYIFPRRRGQVPDAETQLLTIQFEWNGVLKSVSSTLVGVSPEFEVALYTLCFYVGKEENHIELGPYSVNIKCYRFGDRIGSVFPVAVC